MPEMLPIGRKSGIGGICEKSDTSPDTILVPPTKCLASMS